MISEDKRSEWTNKILEIQKDDDFSDNFIDDLKLDIFNDRIFVFTPRGRSIDLPQGATCIDFAYQIHTQVGNRALKGDVNGEIVPMSAVLQNGDTVRIITSDTNKGPDRAWLGFVKTSSARNKIREYLKRISLDEKIKNGKSLLQKEMDRAGLGLVKDLPSKKIREFLAKNPEINSIDDVFSAIGEGAIKPVNILNEFYPRQHVTLSYLNLLEGMLDKNHSEKTTTVSIKIVSKDELGQLTKILKITAGLEINSVRMKAYVTKLSGNLICRLTVILANFSQVSQLFENLEQIDGVKSVRRVFWQKKLFFITGSFFTFVIWAIHPFVLHYITTNVTADEHPILATSLLYVGIFMLFIMVFLLKSLTQRSFPDVRETTAFWVISYLLSTFALITLLAEIYFFRLNFNWFFVFSLIILIFAYMTVEFFSYRKRIMK